MSEEKNKQKKNKEKNSNEIDVNKDFDKRENSNGGYDHPPHSNEEHKKD